ncbi:PHA/PHB synthase family protein [Gymnodinialimonas ceratoperidinii]|uniref:Class I poly(R)-hydroxyalkanoic acid synthase n=1 Tax=Gymnodinialimonas ceratoperidinii TaxID=2856823 RepID=A0A8F6YCH6_9RHOB|nr:class I poly(R)-hydroxyalkanoic acid synthase [Gymnodinialimonas ceratoperidinii]QXT39217.1 class I poly(R)-hydroxyalkanoic acid synthase [Gymnodinialimonas ceratoperidinii]
MSQRSEDDGGAESATPDGGEALERLNANLAKVDALSKRLVAAMGKRPPADQGLSGPSQDLYLKAGAAYWSDAIANPGKLLERQASYWGQAMSQYMEMQEALAQGQLPVAEEDELASDPRFSNPLWRTHPYFSFVRHQYALGSEAIRKAVEELEGLEGRDKQRVEFFASQVIELFSPTNYFATNPDALEKAVETEGESLVQGLENLVRDFETHGGELLPTLADPDAFEVGKNIGTTEGSVVFRNRMLELIQYAPTTEKVHKTPLIIFPPWINKFYVLDLKEKNSLIKWIVDQGYTLFVVSWKNPDESYADCGLEDYIEDGYLAAIEEVKEITGEKQVNAVGYCIAGTTLNLTMALMKKRGDKSIKSATLFTTLTDFSVQGEFTPFLQDDFVDAIERQVEQDGVLDSYFMSRTFSFLRSKDLIYGPAVRSYMMGEAPPAFDLLFWNGDGTNLPGKMATQYLRGLCQGDRLAGGGVDLLGETLSLKDVTVPICAIACETDHIAPWVDSFRGVTKMASKDKTFILSESGHIAGIVNPPSKKKYGHYTNDGVSGEAADWLASATFNEGSWWPRWEKWLTKRSGTKVSARKPGDGGREILAPAPGDYVKEGKSI